jgi:hyperosmotically inducible protein
LASLTQIQVDTDANGVVWLSGTAKTQSDVDKAVAIAKGTDGVVTVKNNLKVKPA